MIEPAMSAECVLTGVDSPKSQRLRGRPKRQSRDELNSLVKDWEALALDRNR